MERGMIFTIEPMFCQGTAIGVQWPDKWTVTTADGGRSAQFEHTVRDFQWRSLHGSAHRASSSLTANVSSRLDPYYG